MSKTRKILLPVLLLLSVGAVTSVMVALRPEQALAPNEEQVLLVDVAEVHLQDLRIPVQAQGTCQCASRHDAGGRGGRHNYCGFRQL